MEEFFDRIERLFQLIMNELAAQRALIPIPLQQPAYADVWLRNDEVMALLGISRRTLYNYWKMGAFDCKQMGRTTFYSKESVMMIRGRRR